MDWASEQRTASGRRASVETAAVFAEAEDSLAARAVACAAVGFAMAGFAAVAMADFAAVATVGFAADDFAVVAMAGSAAATAGSVVAGAQQQQAELAIAVQWKIACWTKKDRILQREPVSEAPVAGSAVRAKLPAELWEKMSVGVLREEMWWQWWWVQSQMD